MDTSPGSIYDSLIEMLRPNEDLTLGTRRLGDNLSVVLKLRVRSTRSRCFAEELDCLTVTAQSPTEHLARLRDAAQSKIWKLEEQLLTARLRHKCRHPENMPMMTNHSTVYDRCPACGEQF